MKIRSLPLTLTAIIALACAPKLEAAPSTDKSPSPTPSETRPSNPLPFTGKIYAVDNVAKTFSTQNKEKKIRVYFITPETKLTKKNLLAAKFEDLKIGEEVRGMAIPKGNGQFEAVSIAIGPHQPPKPSTSPSPSPSASPTPKSTPKSSKKSPTPKSASD